MAGPRFSDLEQRFIRHLAELFTQKKRLNAIAALCTNQAVAQLRVATWNVTNYSSGRVAAFQTAIYGTHQGLASRLPPRESSGSPRHGEQSPQGGRRNGGALYHS
ncbi:MAG: hypothetical protein O7B26_07410 [Planctomycetota bacterium]|nr:hypothetical protein [Planctomycetota bacterium]